jgi:hypothetical protein
VAASGGTNIGDLARVIMSEGSIGNETERTCVGFCVVNRMTEGFVSVRDVWAAFARNQDPTPEIVALATSILSKQVSDPSGGCTHFYSPRSMPKQGEPTAGFDVGGDLELVPPLTSLTFAPSWAKTMTYVPIAEVRPDFFKFFRA